MRCDHRHRRRLADPCKGREHPVRQRWKDSGLQRLQQVEKARYADHRRQHDGPHRLRSGTRAYVVTDEETKTKMLMVDTNCLAHLALNDPMLMVGMPPSYRPPIGIDATHAIEAYICNTHTPYTYLLSLEGGSAGLRLAARRSPRRLEHGRPHEYVLGRVYGRSCLLKRGSRPRAWHCASARAASTTSRTAWQTPFCCRACWSTTVPTAWAALTVAQAMGEKCDNLSVDQLAEEGY